MLDTFASEDKAFLIQLVFLILVTRIQNLDHVLLVITVPSEQLIRFHVRRVNIVRILVQLCVLLAMPVHIVRNKDFLQSVGSVIQDLSASVEQFTNSPTTINLVEFAILVSSASVAWNSNVHLDSTHQPLVFQRAILVHQVTTAVLVRALSRQLHAQQVTTVTQELRFLPLVLMAHTLKVTKTVSKMLVNVLAVRLVSIV